MEILEFGNRDKDKIILIHGFETPYQIWEKYIEYYQDKFHIIVPILNGHNIKIKEDFISFKESAKEIEQYYIQKYGKNVYAIYGMSMGGVLASQIWENGNIRIKKLILDSSPLVSYNKFMTNILVKQYLMLTHKTQKRDKKVVEQAVNSIIPEEKLNEFLEMIDNITDNTICNYITEVGKYKLPTNLGLLDSEIYYFYGTKINEILAKNTAKYLKKNYLNAKLICFKGKGHCEKSILRPEEMIKELDKVL